MHYLRNNKTGKFVSGLLHSIQYGAPCRFITDGNVVLKNMASTYGIDMDDFSVLPATPIPGVTQMKNRILPNVFLNRRARQPSAGPLNGGFWWSEERNAPGRVSFADTVVSLRHTGWFLDSNQDGKARGTVVRLPRGRFLAGIELDSRGVSECALQMFDSAEDAAHDADEQARIYAEAEYEYNEVWQEGAILKDVIEEKTRDVMELFEARHHPRVRSDIKGHIADIRAFQAEFKALCDRYSLSY